MRFFIRLDEFNVLFHHDVNGYLEQHHLPILGPREIQTFIAAQFEINLDQLLTWTNKSQLTDRETALLCRLFPWFIASGSTSERVNAPHVQFSEQFYIEHIDRFNCLIMETLEHIVLQVPNGKRRVWYTRMFYNDLQLEADEDFRIIDWERRMASGEWSRD